MSRITGREVSELMEAYQAIYAPQEEVVEEIVEEDTEQLNEDPALDAARARLRAAQANRSKSEAQATNKKIQAGEKVQINTSGPVLGALGARTTVQRNKQGNLNVISGPGGLEKTIKTGGQTYDRLTQGNRVTYVKRGAAAPTPTGTGTGTGDSGRGGTTPPPNAKNTPASTTVLAKQGGVEGKLDKSTGKFTAGAFTGAEKARYDARAPKLGPTGKPLVGGIERRTPTRSEMDKAAADRAASAGFKTPAGPTTGAAAFNKPAVQTPKPATPLSTTAGFQRPSTTPSGSSAFSQPTINVATKPDTGVQKPTAAIAAKPVQPAVAPTSTQMRQGTFREGVDAYDLILDYLLENGHADTVDEAHYVMLEMDSKTIQSIVEVITTTGEKAPKAVPSPMFPNAPRMGAERPFQAPFINPSGAPFKGASRSVKKDTKTA